MTATDANESISMLRMTLLRGDDSGQARCDRRRDDRAEGLNRVARDLADPPNRREARVDQDQSEHTSTARPRLFKSQLDRSEHEPRLLVERNDHAELRRQRFRQTRV